MADEHNNVPENSDGAKPRGFSSKKNIIFIILVAVLTFGIGSAVIVAGVSNTSENRLSRHMRAAERYLSELNYERAVIEYQRVLEIDPMNVDAILGLADAYIGMGDMEKAIETLRDGMERTGDERIRARLDELTKVEEEPPVSSEPDEPSNDPDETGEPPVGPSSESEEPEEPPVPSEPEEPSSKPEVSEKPAVPSESEEPSSKPEVSEKPPVLSEVEKTSSEPTVPQKMVSVEFKWDGKNQSGELSDLSLRIEGTFDDGSSIFASETDKTVYRSDGNPALQIETWEDDDSRSIKITFHCTDGVYQVTLEDDESMALYQDMAGICDANVQITIIDKNDEIIIRPERYVYLYRSYTGFWVLGICMDHGELGEYHADWMDVTW